jgi:hypothetical protein
MKSVCSCVGLFTKILKMPIKTHFSSWVFLFQENLQCIDVIFICLWMVGGSSFVFMNAYSSYLGNNKDNL